MDNHEDIRTAYNDVGSSWGRINKSRMRWVLKYSGQHILDIGCSKGAYVHNLRAKGYTAFGMDLLPWKEWSMKPDYFQRGSILNLPYKDNSFDTVLAFEVLEHLEDTKQALKELYRVTRKNVIISVPNCDHPPSFRLAGLAYHHWIDRTHRQTFTLEILVNTLTECGFNVTRSGFINPVAPEIILCTSLHLPSKLAEFVGRTFNFIPFRRKYFMTIIILAEKKGL